MKQLGGILSLVYFLERPCLRPRTGDYFGRRAVVLPSLVGLTCGWILLALQLRAGNSQFAVQSLLVTAGLIGVSNGCLSGVNSLMATDFAPGPNSLHVSNYFAVWNVLSSAGTIMAPVIVGWVAQHHSIAAASSVIAAVACGSTGWFYALVPEILKQPGVAKRNKTV